MINRAFFWIANSAQYINEAKISAESVRRHMPDVHRMIVCPETLRDHAGGVFDITLFYKYRREKMWFLRQNEHMLDALRLLDERGVEFAIYLDTDTYVCAPVPELFGLVEDRCAIAGAHAPARHIAPTIYKIPLCFPEINIGVNPMDVPVCCDLYDKVVMHHRTYAEVYGNNDQGVLRDILWFNPDTYPLSIFPPEYNLRLFCGCVKDEVKILHGRTQGETYENLAERINAVKVMRIFYNNEVILV